MISSMRSMAPKIMLLVLLAFLGTIFLDWGMNRGAATSRMTAAGKINGREVPLAYFDQQMNMQRQQIDRAENPQAQEQIRMLPHTVWEQEVQRVILQDVIRKMYLFSSADEVFDFLKRNPLGGVDTAAEFKTNGVFDTNKYIALLNNPRTYENNPEFIKFEQNYREFVLPARKLETLLSAVSAPARAEIEYIYKSQSEKAVFEYAYVKNSAGAVDPSVVTQDMISRYYAAHKDTFKCEDRADVYYIRISNTPTANDESISYREMLSAKNKIMAGKNILDAFIEENNLWNDDERGATDGGDIGWITKGTMGPAFDSAAFKLNPGTVSDPLRTAQGHELIFVENKEKEGKTEKIKARRILHRITSNADSLAEMADSLRRLMVDIGFVKAAKEAAAKNPIVSFDSTGYFEKNNLVPGIGYLSGLGRFVWGPESKEKDAISERLENKEGFYLIAMRRRLEKGTIPLDAVKPAITQTLVDSIQKAAIRVKTEAFLKKINEATPLATLETTDSNTIGSGITDTVTQMGYISEIGQGSPVAAVAFALPVGKRSGLIEHNGTFFIVRPLWKDTLAAIQWGSPDVSMMMGQMMNERKGRVFESWYLDQKKRMKIVSNIDKIYLD